MFPEIKKRIDEHLALREGEAPSPRCFGIGQGGGACFEIRVMMTEGGRRKRQRLDRERRGVETTVFTPERTRDQHGYSLLIGCRKQAIMEAWPSEKSKR
jgi:hypothetical protein